MYDPNVHNPRIPHIHPPHPSPSLSDDYHLTTPVPRQSHSPSPRPPSHPNVIFSWLFCSRYTHETPEIVGEEETVLRYMRCPRRKLRGSHCCVRDRHMIAKSPIPWNAGWPIRNAVTTDGGISLILSWIEGTTFGLTRAIFQHCTFIFLVSSA